MPCGDDDAGDDRLDESDDNKSRCVKIVNRTTRRTSMNARWVVFMMTNEALKD
jgi:hypothetical protein